MIDGMSLAEETEAGSSEFRDRLLALVEERAPDHAEAAKAFAAAYVRRLETYGISAEHLAAEVLGAFRFASDRGRAPVAVRAFNPTSSTTATSRSARCWRPTATTGRSWWTR